MCIELRKGEELMKKRSLPLLAIVIASMLFMCSCGYSELSSSSSSDSTSSYSFWDDLFSSEVSSETSSIVNEDPSSSTPYYSYQESSEEPAVDANANANNEDKKSVVVYITKTGKKYHSYGCGYLSRSCIETTLASAKSTGYTPCSRCNPPR